MKYIDADKIRTEIERLYDGEAPSHDQQCEFEDGYFTGIATISKFIDSLPDEPVCEDFEEAAEKFVGYDMDCDELRDYETGIAAFKAGAEWQKKQIPMPEDTVIFQKGVEECKRTMTDEREIKNVTRDERENLHKLLDQMLDKGQGLGTYRIAYTHPSHNPIYREYRIRITQQDIEYDIAGNNWV